MSYSYINLVHESTLSTVWPCSDDGDFIYLISGAASNYTGVLDELDATHRGCHKFIPRHSDELFIEIGDPIYVEVEADDLWCEGECRTVYKYPHGHVD